MTNSVMAHIQPNQMKLEAHNAFAELCSFPTLLAPKMSAMLVFQVCGIGGNGHVNLSFMGQEMCRINVQGENLHHTGD